MRAIEMFTCRGRQWVIFERRGAFFARDSFGEDTGPYPSAAEARAFAKDAAAR